MQRSKRYKKASEKAIAGKKVSLKEAVAQIKSMDAVKFDESVEVHINLGIDTKKSEQTVRGSTGLPHGTGKQIRIAVFAEEAGQKSATAAGATLVGSDELIEEIAKTQKCDFDVAIAEPLMMKKLPKIAKILGQKGLMPNPKTGTVTPKVDEAVKELLSGKVMFRNDDGGSVHQIVGKKSWEADHLEQNIAAFIQAIKGMKPADVKGAYILRASICSTMSPAVEIDLAAL